jgi:hypothetical protein
LDLGNSYYSDRRRYLGVDQTQIATVQADQKTRRAPELYCAGAFFWLLSGTDVPPTRPEKRNSG